MPLDTRQFASRMRQAYDATGSICNEKNSISVAGGFCGFLSITSESHSEHFILGVDPANQSRDDYRVGLLRLALEQAAGDHTMEVVYFDVNRSRAIRALAAGSAVFNVIDSGNSRSREKRLTLVPIPLTRGLLGYRLLVVKRSNLHLFSDIDNFDSLQWKITFGSSPSWPDTEIMRHSGLKVVTGEKVNCTRC